MFGYTSFPGQGARFADAGLTKLKHFENVFTGHEGFRVNPTLWTPSYYQKRGIGIRLFPLRLGCRVHFSAQFFKHDFMRVDWTTTAAPNFSFLSGPSLFPSGCCERELGADMTKVESGLGGENAALQCAVMCCLFLFCHCTSMCWLSSLETSAVFLQLLQTKATGRRPHSPEIVGGRYVSSWRYHACKVCIAFEIFRCLEMSRDERKMRRSEYIWTGGYHPSR